MLSFFRFIKGYVKIKVWGYSPERFMNLCSNRDILLWDVVNYQSYYIMNISIKGFFALKPIARKTKTKVVIIQKYGLPFFMTKIRKRFIFTMGVLGCFLFLFMMSGFIWTIEIKGNQRISKEEVLDYLATQDVYCGMKKSNLQVEKLKRDIRNQYSNVIWNSIQLNGTKLTVEIKEGIGLNKKKEIDDGKPYDLISKKEGMIVYMVTRKGIPLHKKGDTVSENEILVSGLIPILQDDGTTLKYQYCVADADVSIQYIYHYKDKIPKEYEKKVFIKNDIHFFMIELFGKEFRFPHKKNQFKQYDILTDIHQVKLFENLYLPVFYGKKVIKGYQLEKKVYSSEEINRIAKEHLNQFLITLKEKGVQIIEKNVKIEKNVDSKHNDINVSGTIVIIEKTGENVPSENAGETGITDG